MSENPVARYMWSAFIAKTPKLLDFREEKVVERVRFRPDGIVTNATEPNQSVIGYMHFLVRGREMPQLVGSSDAYVFSATAMVREREAYMARYGLKTRTEYIAFVARVERAWDRYELRGGKRPKEDLPPEQPRLDMNTLEPGSRVIIGGKFLTGNQLTVCLTGWGQEVETPEFTEERDG